MCPLQGIYIARNGNKKVAVSWFSKSPGRALVAMFLAVEAGQSICLAEKFFDGKNLIESGVVLYG